MKGSLTENRLTIRNRHIHVMLFPMLIDRESFKCQVSSWTVVRLYWSWEIEW